MNLMEAKRKEPSQHEIAARAGVARTTVSLVMRGGEGLKQETIDKVQKAAKELGYRPNLMATMTRSGKSRMVGVMVPPIDSYWARITCGIHDYLTEKKYIPLFLWPSHMFEDLDEHRELEQVHLMLDCRIGGVILWPHFARMFEKHIHEFSSRNLPVVTVDCDIQQTEVEADSVLGDNRAGAIAVAEHFKELGHRNVIHFCGPDSEDWARVRREAFAEAIECRSIEVELRPRRIPVIKKALQDFPETTAVFASTDNFAHDVYRVAEELGLRIPDDLSVVGYSDLDFSQYLNPPLTTVHDNPYNMGKRAAAAIVQRIQGVAEGDPTVELLPVNLLVRGSTKAL